MERSDPGEIVKRALAYPFARPRGSFVFEGGEARPLPEDPGATAGFGTLALDLAGRVPLLAYGANAAPAALARKLPAGSGPLPVLLAELADHEVVYSAHVSPYGAIPATLHPSPGAAATVHVAYPDAEQLPPLVASELNYELTRLREIVCTVAAGGDRPVARGGLREVSGRDLILTAVDAFASRHGPLLLEGAPLALAAIPARGRTLRRLTEPEVLELVRSRLVPDLTLEQFVAGCAQLGGIAPLAPLA